ncbi:glycosyltransferase family 4 protein [Ruegeria meonggei]|uniref:D-inositol-3-phosphate glycosyltransferase n=1 Tax=Ruegeria meonggei TaxID=1446476 RepID=A0A1X6ZI15_9RHOB|nr:glycosyltransferase family 4 protein [Ruegeria meonggei]SLN50253.1 D-inositol-3-phosphate glycosyltransferase [Ruegeria meonggei]
MPTNVVNIPYGVKNPYQNMMYMSCEPEFALSKMRNPDVNSFGRSEFQSENGIVHIHWDDRLFPASAESGSQPDQGFLRTRDALKQFRANGGRIIWTIHNRFAHSQTSENDGLKAVREQLVKLVDLIHVHTPHAKRYMIEEFGADSDRIRLIPHPSYLGVYEPEDTTLNRPMALRDTSRFLTFGAMRGNRELDRLEFAARKLANRGFDFRLAVIGRTVRANRRLLRQMNANPYVTVTPERIPDSQIPGVFSAANAYVLPSTRTFTSGTAMLAQSFGLPIIGPDIEPHRQTTPSECHDLLYPIGNPRGLIRMLMRVMDMSDEELGEKRRACFEFSKERHPKLISRSLAQVLTELNSG